jgi:uncharacterized protein YqeY
MSIIIETIRKDLVAAIRAKEETKKNMLRIVLSDVELECSKENKACTDEKVLSVIRKNLKGYQDLLNTYEAARANPETQIKVDILKSYLPQTLSQEEIEAKFLNDDGNTFEQIKQAKSDGQATGIAMKFVKAANLSINNEDVAAVVKKIREA